MNSERLLRGALFIGGLLTAMIGVDHIFMPTIGYDSSVLWKWNRLLASVSIIWASTLSALFYYCWPFFLFIFPGLNTLGRLWSSVPFSSCCG
jgi:hypothetical protein